MHGKSTLWALIVLVIMSASCSLVGDIEGLRPDPPDNHPDDPSQNTFIVFDNTQGICTAFVYDDYRRGKENKIAEIPPGRSSGEIEWMPGESVPFYFSYSVTLKGISGFTLDYIPEIGKDQKTVRIDANTKTTIKIPTLSETLSSPDTLLSNNSYLLIQNNSSYSFRLHRETSEILPDYSSAALVNSGERAQYTINPRPAANYRLLVGANYCIFPDSPIDFEAGHIYNFDFNGSILLVRDTELKLENVTGIIIPQSPAAPTVITSNGLITLQWTAVEGATAYEIWVSTVSDSSLALKYGVDVVSSLFTTINGLNNGTTYYVWLKAKNTIGTSGFSPVATGIPSASTVKPPDPQTAPSVIVGNEQLSVSWQPVEEADVYEIWTGTTNNTQTAVKQGEDVSDFPVVMSGLNNGTTYYVWIKAKNNIGVSGFSPAASGKPIGNAAVPSVSVGNGELLVSWSAVAGADQYEVFCGTEANPPETAAQTVTVTSVTVSGLTNGTTYNVWIRGKNATGTGIMSSPANAMPIGNMGTITVSSGNEQILLDWPAVDGADEYEVYYSTSSSIPASPSQTVSTATVTISGLTNGTTYYVWVKAKNTNGTSNTSTAVNGKPLGTPGMPTISPEGYGQLLLVTWSPIAGADQYEVYYGTDTPTTLFTTTTDTTAIITGLTNGTTYYVCLRAKNVNGISDYGPSASGMPDISPGLYRGNEKIGTQNLVDSLTYILSNAVSGDDFYIVLGANESISPTDLNYSGKTVGITLLGYGSERIITLNTSGNMFNVNSGVTLTLDENITLIGRSTNNASLVYVSGGNLIMNGRAKITGNNTSGGGGGVYMSNGAFTMNGGTIRGNTSNYGGGICISGSGIFNKHSGTISENTGGDIYFW